MSFFPIFLSSDGCFDLSVDGLGGRLSGGGVAVPGCSERAREVLDKAKCESVANVYKETRQYKVSGEALNKIISRYDDSKSKGKYHTLDLEEWEEVDYWKSDENRIGVGRPHSGKELTIFMQVDNAGKTKTCDNYLMFCKQHFIELRKLRGEDKYTEIVVPVNGQIWIGSDNINKTFRVFVGRVKDEIKEN